MRRSAALLALTSFALLVVPASAAAPKKGTYIDTKLQVYVTVGAKRTSISSLSAPCVRKLPNGTTQSYGGFLLPKTKHPKISSKGSFSYSGNVTLTTSSKSVVPVKITGKFANGKVNGNVKLDEAKTGCAPYDFTGKYYGVNPKG
jgi:hypothetical protein